MRRRLAHATRGICEAVCCAARGRAETCRFHWTAMRHSSMWGGHHRGHPDPARYTDRDRAGSVLQRVPGIPILAGTHWICAVPGTATGLKVGTVSESVKRTFRFAVG
jgi:hypothetical protein